MRAEHDGAQVEVEWLESNEPSYLLYTSGTTGKPKGVQRDVGGYAVALALSMRVVGILLVAALMVLPVSAAERVAWSMRSTLALAMAIGLASAVLGLTVSYYADLPPGGTIVLVAAGTAAACAFAGSVRGR